MYCKVRKKVGLRTYTRHTRYRLGIAAALDEYLAVHAPEDVINSDVEDLPVEDDVAPDTPAVQPNPQEQWPHPEDDFDAMYTDNPFEMPIHDVPSPDPSFNERELPPAEHMIDGVQVSFVDLLYCLQC